MKTTKLTTKARDNHGNRYDVEIREENRYGRTGRPSLVLDIKETPGTWYLEDLASAANQTAIDYGQDWFCTNMHALRAEAEMLADRPEVIEIETREDAIGGDLAGRRTEFTLKAFDKLYRGTTLTKRFGICFVAEDQEARQEFEGPLVPGPWAQTFGLATAICSDPSLNSSAESARNIAAGTEAIVADGDLIQIDQHLFRIEIYRDFSELRMNLHLVEVSDAELATSLAVEAAELLEANLVLKDKLAAAERRAAEAEGRVQRLEGYIESYKSLCREMEGQ